MKKIITLILLAGTLSLAGFSQLPTGDITIENPRIIGSTFYWDVYFMRTNNDAQWYVLGAAVLGNSSWYFNFNLTDLTNYQIVYENPTLFPVGGNYTNTIGPNGGFLEINTLYVQSVLPTNDFGYTCSIVKSFIDTNSLQ